MTVQVRTVVGLGGVVYLVAETDNLSEEDIASDITDINNNGDEGKEYLLLSESQNKRTL